MKIELPFGDPLLPLTLKPKFALPVVLPASGTQPPPFVCVSLDPIATLTVPSPTGSAVQYPFAGSILTYTTYVSAARPGRNVNASPLASTGTLPTVKSGVLPKLLDLKI